MFFIPNHPSFQLINPSKSDIGRMSKKILDKINKIVILETNVNQWKNRNSVISWFKRLQNGNRLSFVNFDVQSYCPFISENLFQEATNFAKDIVELSDTELLIVMQTRKTLFSIMTYHGLNIQEIRNLTCQWVHMMVQRSAN